MHALAEEGRIGVPERGSVTVTQEINAGVLPVSLENLDGQLQIVMTQATPQFFAEVPRDEMAPVLGLSPSDIPAGSPIQVVSTGTNQVMVAGRLDGKH